MTALVMVNPTGEGISRGTRGYLPDRRGQFLVVAINDEYRQQLCRFGFARVPPDGMARARRFGPALARAIRAYFTIVHF